MTGYPETGGITASTLYDYGFDNFAGFPNTHDVGLVILDAPVQTVYPDIDTYASLAAAGTLDTYGTGQDATVTVSGYGVSLINPAKTESFRSRLMATTFITEPRQPQHRRLQRPDRHQSRWRAGRHLLRGLRRPDPAGRHRRDHRSELLCAGAATTCGGVAFAYRTDQQAVIDWILEHAGAEADEITIVTI